MPQPNPMNLDEREAAIAASIAARTLKEDRLDAEREASAAPSTRALVLSVVFVIVASIGGLVAMLAVQ